MRTRSEEYFERARQMQVKARQSRLAEHRAEYEALSGEWLALAEDAARPTDAEADA